MKEAQYRLHRDELIQLGNTGHAASTDEARQILTCVNICVGPKALYAVATDSYMLVVNHVTDAPQANRKAWSVSVSAKNLRSVVGRCKKNDLYPVTVSTTGIEVETDEGTTKLEAYDGTFPDWAKIAKKETKGDKAPFPLGFTINPEFVARLGKALGCTASNPLTLSPLHPLEPILAGPLLGKSFGLLMPIRAYDTPTVAVEFSVAKVAA